MFNSNSIQQENYCIGIPGLKYLPSANSPTIFQDHNKLFEKVPHQTDPKLRNDMPFPRNFETLSEHKIEENDI